jgi:hypothetical protein
MMARAGRSIVAGATGTTRSPRTTPTPASVPTQSVPAASSKKQPPQLAATPRVGP